MSRVDAAFALEAELAPDVWVDITEDVIDSEAKASYGIKGNDPNQRMAGTGQLFFELNNSHSNSTGTLGYYSPGRYACREGFAGGMRVRARFTYEGKTYYKFLGRVPKNGIRAEAGLWDGRRTGVEVRDWMEYAASYEIRGREVQTGLRADQALQVLIGDLPLPLRPQNTAFSSGQDAFETVFDKAKAGTVLMSEAAKLVASEPGYLYVKRDQTHGETLVFENRFDRFLREKREIQRSLAYARNLCTEDGVLLLTEDGQQIVIDDTYEADFEDFRDVQPEFGGQVYNRVHGRVYPRYADTTPQVLARLQSPIFLAAGASVTVQIPYRDPNNKALNVAGFNMQPPEEGTDYTFNSLKDGSGADLTSDLGVSPAYGSSEVYTTFSNNGLVDGWVLAYQAVGYGLYAYDTVSYVAEDATVEFGAETLELDMPYQVDPIKAQVFSQFYLDEYGQAVGGFQWVDLTANVSDKHMRAFLTKEPGDRVGLREAVTGVVHDFYINGCEWAHQTEVIHFRWYVMRTSDMAVNWARYDMSVYDDASEGYAI